MSKTTIDVDKGLAAQAAAILGTQTLKDTVNTAMLEVVRHELRRELADDIRSGRLTMPTPADVARSQEPRLTAGALDAAESVLSRAGTRRSA